MPRPTRASRLRRGAEATPAASNTSSDPAAPALAPAPATIEKFTIISSDNAEDIYGVSDREVERQRRLSVGSNASAVALAAAQRDREAALSRLDNLTSTTGDAMNSSDVPELGRKEMAIESSLLGHKGLGMESSLLGGARGNLSGMEINDSEIFGNLDSSFDDAGAKETTGSHSGTRSADTSTFNVSVFRRQPSRRRRQSSIVGKDDAPIRPSSRGPTTPGLGSTLNLGNFRRRQRQPSILLSSAQKANLGLQRSRATSAETETAVAVDSDMEESFLPEAEGTPVRLSRGRNSAAGQAEEGSEATPDVDVGRETRSKKRKSTESHETEAAKRQAVEREASETIHDSVEADMPSSPLSVHDSEPSSPPSFIMRSIQRRRVSQGLDSDILAPPVDSDSEEDGPMMWPSLKDLGKKRHGGPSRTQKATPALEDDDMSDLSDPPSLTHSPNFKATKPAAKVKRQESPKLSTADLEALLPRRRRKARRDPYDSDNQENSASEQEERPRRAAKKKPAKPLNGISKTNRTNTTSTAPASAPAKRTTRRTYGSRSFDEENTIEGDSIEVNEEASTPLDDTAFEADVNEETTTTLGLPAELKAASKKFKEVDKWELEFEEVVEPSSDLPEGR
ncbi:hypothetical protein N0V93_004746 [Gnomoniopsis smithogilvyi]|uniref:Uncharacterized protein n=1 Tax=Gnomoniopsis smithogilvyi TaxID=1191159 RepID=A0A9W9CXG6_9PEZI|nr:hypothetical protein N0V93_004746 [Gnomoniopsis smithogilvyi]